MLSEAIRFEAGHFGVQVTIIQPGTIGTDMTEREQKFERPEYAPLVQQYAERFARYRQRRAPRPSRSPARSPTWSTVAACRCASRSGCAQNGCSPGSPQACWAGSSGRHTSGNARAAPNPAPRRQTITTYGCRRRQRTVNPPLASTEVNCS